MLLLHAHSVELNLYILADIEVFGAKKFGYEVKLHNFQEFEKQQEEVFNSNYSQKV